MPKPNYTLATTSAKLVLPANPPQKHLRGLPRDQRAEAHRAHRETWLQHRSSGIGASDAATILEINPYGSLTQVYAEKAHGYTQSDNDAMRLGREMEPLVVERFAEATGLRVRQCGLFANREQPWMMATPDRLVSDGGGLEIKTTTERNGGHAWDGQPSDLAMAQVQWSMATTGANHWWVAVMFRDTGAFRYYQVERDEELIQVLVERASAFWHGNVLQACAPPLDGSEATEESVKAMHPHSDDNTQTDGGEKAASTRRRLTRIQQHIKELKNEERQAKNELLAMAGEAGTLLANGTKVATMRRNGTFQSSRYTKDHPERADRFMTKVEKLDHKAALAEDPDAYDYVPRVVRLSSDQGWEPALAA